MSLKYTFEFDTSNQNQWDTLLKAAEDERIDISGCPKEAPADVQEWINLIEEIPIGYIAESEEDVWTYRAGAIDEATVEVFNEDGQEI